MKFLAWITPARAVLVPALLAVFIHVGALDNEWAIDDPPIIIENPNAQTLDAALAAFFDTYWPEVAGQYRPGIILSYAVDWELTGANPVWSHGVNVVLHGVVTALFVLVISAWLSSVAALAAGLVFAVHPVHVEAVAGVVGRAELAVAALLFGAILLARKYRNAPDGWARTGWLTGTLVCVLAAMLSKEHGIVAIALLALDEITTGRPRLRRNLPVYLGVGVVSLAWLTIFNAVAGQFVEGAVAATIRSLDTLERLATVAPIQLHVVRLLVWPFDLAADYNPQVLPRLTSWTWQATVGALVAGSIVMLSILQYRKHPALTFGVWMAIITYSPTSNILFGSGIILAERNLYMAAGATAIAVGLLIRDRERLARLPLLGAAVLLLVGVYGWKTVDRVPAWKDTATMVIEDYIGHPENYRARLRMAAAMRDNGRPAQAMAEATAAAAIFPEDPFISLAVVPHILKMGYTELAAAEAERTHAMDPENTGLSRLAVRARLGTDRRDSALALGRRTLELFPEDSVAANTYLEVVDTLRVPDWARSLAQAHSGWTSEGLVAGTEALTRGTAQLPDSIELAGCWDLWTGMKAARRMAPDLVGPMERRFAPCGALPSVSAVGSRQLPE